MLGDSELAKAQRLGAILNLLTSIDPPITLHYARALMEVAASPGLGTTEYARRLKLEQGVASRILLEIGLKLRSGEPGRGLMEAEGDAVDLRQKHYYLTKSGQEIVHRILEVY
jgi:DNA-binding MarR family transcriptional regulator